MPTGFTTVSAAHLQDATGTPITNATISFLPVDNRSVPLSFRAGGAEGQVISQAVTALVTSGAFSLELADTSLTSPVNIGYRVAVTDNVSGLPLLGSGYACVQPTGDAWSLDTFIPALSAQVTVQAGPTGATGLSAYQLYQGAGGSLSLNDWLASLHGADGGITTPVPNVVEFQMGLTINGGGVQSIPQNDSSNDLFQWVDGSPDRRLVLRVDAAGKLQGTFPDRLETAATAAPIALTAALAAQAATVSLSTIPVADTSGDVLQFVDGSLDAKKLLWVNSDGRLDALFATRLEQGATNAAAALSTANAALASVGSGALSKLRRLAGIAATRNAVDLPAMPSPPTITYPSATSLTKAYPANLTDFLVTGGAPYISAGAIGVHSVTIGTVSGGAIGVGQGTGCGLDFYADCAVLEISGSSGVQILVDDQYIVKSTIQTPTGIYRLDFTQGGTVSYTDARRVRRIRVEWQFGGCVTAVNVGATETIWAPEASDVLRVAVFGDSFSENTGGTLVGGSWSSVCAKLLGCRSHQSIAIGGTGYVAPGSAWPFLSHVNDLTLAPIDILIFGGGANDGSYVPQLQAAALALFQAARALLPNVPFFIVPNCCVENDGNKLVENTIFQAVDIFNDANTYKVPVATALTSPWITGTGYVGAPTGVGNRDLYIGGPTGVDGVHPNNAGHEYLGRRTANGILTAIGG